MKAAGPDMEEMNYRERSFDEFLPWSHPRHGMDDGYLQMEWKRSVDEAYTPPCDKAVSDVVYVNRRHLMNQSVKRIDVKAPHWYLVYMKLRIGQIVFLLQ